MDRRDGRVETRRLLELRQRGVELAEPVVERVADFVVDTRAAGVQPLRLVQFREGLLGFPERRECDAQIQMGDGVLRIQPDGRAEWLDGVGDASHVVIHAAETEVGSRECRIQPNGLPEGVNRLVVLALRRIACTVREGTCRRWRLGVAARRDHGE
jgi:hypothetical protein